ncbi:NAD-dependent epimerase/dehydratase family protein (plasmid) [Agrobacterium sp. MA01]|nr:3-beta hydroxysteroid dehydrogenase/isomerase family protein [Agrobacterium sp. RAC06]QGG93510.1 NAD-dependent epimerase/dehydratase family protein [Agrobacterium sp. MA01]
MNRPTGDSRRARTEIKDARLIVTGANGLLGRQVVSALAPTNEVVALVHRLPENPVAGVRYQAIDFSTSWDAGLLPERADGIVHLAQSAHFRDVPAKALEVFQVNIASTARLLDYAWRKGVSRFAYASSGGIYGSGDPAFRETSPVIQPGTLGYYLGSKVSCEALVSSYAAFMKIMVLRFFFIYGAGQNRTMLIPRLIDNIREGRPVTIQGERGLRLNPVHVSDASAAVVAALTSEADGVYNIGGPQVLALRELCAEIERLTGRSALIHTTEGVPSDVVGDITRMSQNLHAPLVYPRDGLKDVL